MITLVLSAAVAGATDLHVELTVGEGATESWMVPPTEAVTEKIGPVTSGKTSAVYTVSVMPSVWDTLQGGYKVDVSVCRDWVRKGKKGRHCQKEPMLAKSEADGPSTTTTNLSVDGEKYSYVLKAWYSGEAPGPIGLPMPEPEPTDEAETP
jgi:hypothetical protein